MIVTSVGLNTSCMNIAFDIHATRGLSTLKSYSFNAAFCCIPDVQFHDH